MIEEDTEEATGHGDHVQTTENEGIPQEKATEEDKTSDVELITEGEREPQRDHGRKVEGLEREGEVNEEGELQREGEEREEDVRREEWEMQSVGEGREGEEEEPFMMREMDETAERVGNTKEEHVETKRFWFYTSDENEEPAKAFKAIILTDKRPKKQNRKYSQ